MVGRVLCWVGYLVLVALFVSMTVQAVGNLMLLPQAAESIGLAISGTGWFWLGAGVALPLIALALGVCVAWKRSAPARILVLATALAVAAAVQLEVTHLVPQSSFFA